MRDTNDVKYEFKFDHVLILVSASVVDHSWKLESHARNRPWKTDAGAVASRTDTLHHLSPEKKALAYTCIFLFFGKWLHVNWWFQKDILGSPMASSFFRGFLLGQRHRADDDGLGANQVGQSGGHSGVRRTRGICVCVASGQKLKKKQMKIWQRRVNMGELMGELMDANGELG